MTVDRSKYILMGIDPGTIACGWALGDLDGVLKKSGAIVLPASMDTNERTFHIAEFLGELVIKYRVSAIYCEAPLVFLGAHTALVLGAVSGVINYVIWKATDGLQVNYLESNVVRKLIGVPKIKRKKGRKLAKGEVKANALKWIRALMRDMGLPYKKGKPVPLGEEDRLEAVGIFWAGCREISGGIDEAIEASLIAQVKARKKS